MNNTTRFSLTKLWTSFMLITLLLIACGTDPAETPGTETPGGEPPEGETSTSPNFSLSVSGGVNAVTGATGTIDITITRTNGFSEAVTLSVTGLPAGVTPTFTPNPSDGAASILNLAVERSVAPGDYPLTLEGNAGSLQKTTPLVLTVTPSPSDINAIAIQGNGSSTQVRQGAGVITVGVAGRGLKDISSASLGALSGTVVTNNDKAASLTFTIPSGAEVGPQTLRLETALGVAEQLEAITISKITVSNTGDDTAGKGTPDKPFKTINFAIGRAGSGDTVRLLDGTYNQASGETFPFTFPSGVTLTLEGESETGTVIQGTSVVECLNVTASDVAISAMTIKDCDSGILARNSVEVTISNATLTENSTGLFVDGTAQVRMENSTVENSDFIGARAEDDSQLEIRGGSISGNGLAGFISGVTTLQTAAGVLRLEGVTVERNTGGGLRLDSQGAVEVFDCVIKNNDRDGVSLIEVGPVNLGDATRAGNNTITDNGDFQLSDERSASSVVITAFGNTIGGTGSLLSGVQEGPFIDGTSWQITSVGNQIDFGP
jgi:Protein of unknown function (DUF1565)